MEHGHGQHRKKRSAETRDGGDGEQRLAKKFRALDIGTLPRPKNYAAHCLD